VVSTPNQLYYTASRGPEGANPFHAHEFEFAEFQRELARVFPHVCLFLENHVEGVTFQPFGAQPAADVRVDTGQTRPEDAHFFIAVCAHRPQVGGPTFVYVPRAANVLREREKHIALLAGELRAKDAWLEEARGSLAALNDEHQNLLEMFRAQNEELERSNLWAQQLDENLTATRLRIAGLQDELAAQQATAREMAAGYQAKVAELEEDLRVKAEWAVEIERRLMAELTARAEELESKCAELARCVEILHAVEKDLEERTAWALRLEASARDLEARLAMFRASRWVKLGQTVGLGPEKTSV
jgi:septal ring factor EnvC (AmiA/AmiB activator)